MVRVRYVGNAGLGTGPMRHLVRLCIRPVLATGKIRDSEAAVCAGATGLIRWSLVGPGCRLSRLGMLFCCHGLDGVKENTSMVSYTTRRTGLMKRYMVCLSGLLCFFSCIDSVRAVPMIIGIGDFPADYAMIDFETIPDETEIRDQFADMGVLFRGGLFGDDDNTGPFGGGTVAANFEIDNTGPFNNPVGALFDPLVTHVGFMIRSEDDRDIRVQARRDNVITFNQVFNTDSTPSFIGIKDVDGFDELRFGVAPNQGSGPLRFQMDNFMFVQVVPEPVTGAMGLVALGGLVGRLRRRR